MGFFNNHLSSAATSGPAWLSGQTYNVNDMVVYNTTTYVCLVAHTAGSSLFTDLASGFWRIVSGTKNYISNSNFESGSTTGWSLSHSTLDSTSKLPNQASGSWTAASANLAITTTSVGKIAGTQSLQLNQSTAASVAGDMLVSDAFTIDTADQAKVLTFNLSYSVTANASNLNLSGTSANSVGVAVYDVTNSAWIQPAGVFNLVQSSGVGKATGTFQTSSNSTSYRLAIYFPNASSGIFTMMLDEISVGPQTTSIGPAMSDWQAYMPSFNGFGTPSSVSFFWRRVGDSLEVTGNFTPVGATSAEARVGFPTGLVSSSALPTLSIAGSVSTGGLSTNVAIPIVLVEPSVTYFTFGTYQGAANSLAKVGGNGCATGATSIFAKVQIAGWSSNTVQSSDTDTRVVAATIGMNSAYSATANAVIKYDTPVFDTHSCYSASTGLYTVPVSGYYKVTVVAEANSVVSPYVVKGSVNQVAILSTSGSGYAGCGSYTLKCNAGETIGVYSDRITTLGAISGSGYQNAFSIERLSGPAVVQASETVAAAYYINSSISLTSNTIVNFDGRDYDTHGAVTTGASWKFTAPVTGVYLFAGYMGLTTATGNNLILYKNGSTLRRVCRIENSNGEGEISGSIRLLAGEYIDFRANSTAGTAIASGLCYLSITRVGN